jgi:hypothetical protein
VTELTYSALREYRKRIRAMLDDPECNDDLLGLGIALLDFAILRIDRDERTWRHYAEQAWGEAGDYRIRGVLKRDIRRYDAAKDADAVDPMRKCAAPMVRRQGACGQSAFRRTMLTDPDTGRRQWLAACRRHEDWFTARVRDNRLAVDAVEEVTRPPANAGGVLARHIPEIAWEETWRKLDPNWTPPPEAEPEEVPLKPRLTLVLGGAS